MHLASQLKIQKYYCGSHTTTVMDTLIQGLIF